MEVVKLKTADIIPYEKNAKKHDERQIANVMESIKQFGFVQPLVVDRDGVLIIGHCRLLAAKRLGMEEVDAVIASELTQEQVDKLRLLDNKLNESDWDMDLLLEGISELDFEGFDIDWDLPELKEETVEEVIEDEVPEEIEERTKPGDVWKLGNHRLLCGDCTDVHNIDKLMNGAVADLVFTDPPYGMKKEKDGVLNDNLNENDLLDFNRQWIPLTFGALKDTGCWYCWGIDEPLMDIYSEILKPMKKANQIVIRNYITWAKHSAYGVNSGEMLSYPKETERCWFVMKGIDWNNTNAEWFDDKYEAILKYMEEEAEKVNLTPQKLKEICGVQMFSHWFTKSQFVIITEKHYNELRAAFAGCFTKPYKELRALLGEETRKPYFDAKAIDNVGDIGLTDVWRFSQTSNEEREGLGHATPKPIALCARGIHASTKEGENVLDVFGGSGSTLIACEQLGRNCYMMELDPHYCDVIIARWEKFTGETAELMEEKEGGNIDK